MFPYTRYVRPCPSVRFVFLRTKYGKKIYKKKTYFRPSNVLKLFRKIMDDIHTFGLKMFFGKVYENLTSKGAAKTIIKVGTILHKYLYFFDFLKNRFLLKRLFIFMNCRLTFKSQKSWLENVPHKVFLSGKSSFQYFWKKFYILQVFLRFKSTIKVYGPYKFFLLNCYSFRFYRFWLGLIVGR